MRRDSVERWFAALLIALPSLCAAASLRQDILDIDWGSLLLSAVAGLFGGLGRTMLSLMLRRVLVANPPMVLVKDLGVSVVCGVIVYIVVSAWNEGAATFFHWSPVTGDLRIALLAAAGFAPRWAFGRIERVANAAFTRAQRTISGSDDPISENAALEPKK